MPAMPRATTRPENANLLQVIDRRIGLPVSLGILYIHAGRAQGWAVDGAGLPRPFPGAHGGKATAA